MTYNMQRYSLFALRGTHRILLVSLLALALLLWKGAWVMMPLLPVIALLMLYYYDPDRQLPSHPLGVMSPIDGTVTMVDLFHDPFLQRPARRIRIRPHLLRVYHSRSPTEGKLMEYWPQRSAQGYGYADIKAALWIQTDELDNLTMIISGKSAAGRPECTVQAGERIGQGARCGRFPIFSRVDILIDQNAYLNVQPGQTVKAGIDTLATFNHDDGAREPQKTTAGDTRNGSSTGSPNV